MKTKHYLSIFIITLSIVSCTPDKNNDPDAPAPSIDVRDKFVANWLCTEVSKTNGTTTTFTINITKSTTNASQILIDKFYNVNAEAKVSVSSANSSINIPYQQLATIGFTKGSGSLSSNGSILTMAYTTEIGANKDTCTATCVK